MDNKLFTIGQSTSFGWEKTKDHFVDLLKVLAVFILIQIVFSILSEKMGSSIGALISLVSFAANLIMGMGLVVIALNIVRGKTFSVNDLFNHYQNFLNYFLGSIVYGLIVMVGMVLLIIPGLYFAVKYVFVPYLIIDKNLGPMEALAKSGEMTNGYKWDIFLLQLFLLVLNLGGALLLGIGLLATIPISMIAMAYVYLRLAEPTSQPAAAPVKPAESQPAA